VEYGWIERGFREVRKEIALANRKRSFLGMKADFYVVIGISERFLLL
jgi:hypothetical protein